jgi:type III restriction enzyme
MLFTDKFLNTLRNLSEPAASKTIVETFKKKINELTVQDKGSAEIRAYIKIKQTRPFVVKEQGYLVPQKSIFNKIIDDSRLELEFASFLEKCGDIYYVNADGNISRYYPDFIVKTGANDIFIVETKGLEYLDVPLKMVRLKKWCEDINTSRKNLHFDYVFVDEEDFSKYKPDSFSSLVSNFRRYKDED